MGAVLSHVRRGITELRQQFVEEQRQLQVAASMHPRWGCDAVAVLFSPVGAMDDAHVDFACGSFRNLGITATVPDFGRDGGFQIWYFFSKAFSVINSQFNRPEG